MRHRFAHTLVQQTMLSAATALAGIAAAEAARVLHAKYTLPKPANQKFGFDIPGIR